MEPAIIILIALACSAAVSILAFMVGRCGRKLPIDGMLPRVVHSARFSSDKDRPRPAPEHSRLCPTIRTALLTGGNVAGQRSAFANDGPVPAPAKAR